MRGALGRKDDGVQLHTVAHRDHHVLAHEIEAVIGGGKGLRAFVGLRHRRHRQGQDGGCQDYRTQSLHDLRPCKIATDTIDASATMSIAQKRPPPAKPEAARPGRRGGRKGAEKLCYFFPLPVQTGRGRERNEVNAIG